MIRFSPTARLSWLPWLFTALLLLGVAPQQALLAQNGGDVEEGKGGEQAEEKPEKGPLSSATFSGLKLRSIGPAVASGRIVDLAVDPGNRKIYYAAAASGGVWKTVNDGTTFEPVFDGQKSYSIGAITLDPNDSSIVWVGTGENNSQRSVSYGDGVYKSVDGGKSWKNVGLEKSEHVGMIKVDPRDSDVVWVAAQGPLWSSGGDRGLYKTEDGGKTWKRKLEIDEHTGVSEVFLDPRNPDRMLAVAYQRARRVWTLINGGPGSGIHRSTDGGESWDEVTAGLPSEDMGRVGMAVSPADPDVVYAVIETDGPGEGTYRSTNGGVTWEKRSSYVSGSPQYYQELIADPKNPNRVYSMDTFMMVSEDGGATFERVGNDEKHVDDHALWIDPEDTDYLLAGCDGGIYQSFDRGQTWRFMPNLPLTQFYKIAVSNDEPFYFVYGGTQDNNTLGGPSRTINSRGIVNHDWFVTVGGDGFQPAVDPDNPNIVYSESQHGVLQRFDRLTGEAVDIRPRAELGEEPLKWNWDSPLLISPHENERLYFGAQRLYRSDDRGDSWEAISPDLTRRIDRNTLEIMGKVWGHDAVAKHDSTSIYGNLVAVDESPLVEGLVYTGADDGRVSVLDPETGEWRFVDELPGVPRLSYVADVVASRHDADTVYLAPNNHKEGDFAPYLLVSDDRGQTWRHIEGDLPERGSTWVLVEDPVDPNLLFVGTEFGVFFTVDARRPRPEPSSSGDSDSSRRRRGGDSGEGGEDAKAGKWPRWIQLSSGLPTIAVRDIKIQEREADLVLGTFGRSFYVLDDITPLRGLTEETLEAEAVLFSVKDPLLYLEASPGTGSMGHSEYGAPNPTVGAVFTYYLKEGLKSKEDLRKERMKEAEKNDEVYLPTLEELREEERARDPQIVLTVEDAEGNVVRRLTGPARKGIHRVDWDFRYPAVTPVQTGGGGRGRGGRFAPRGPLAIPGEYRVRLAKTVDGQWTELAGPVPFRSKLLHEGSLPVKDRAAVLAFHRQTADLQRAVMGAARVAADTGNRLDALRQAAWDTSAVSTDLLQEIDALDLRLADLRLELEGDRLIRQLGEAEPDSLMDRVNTAVRGWFTTAGPTEIQRQNHRLAAHAFGPWLEKLRELVEVDVVEVEDRLEAAGAPWTPGRVPRWEGR
ncbi:MAG TPA: glycosyl hydrolase [Thermoanaerobaculia bacterium]|nr:glycosyl hydrolase [Thermoanaerobaculia bacterium]